MISALTWVLQKLLREQVSIADFAPIVSEFIRCRSLKLDMESMGEQIRDSLKARNSLQE